MKPCLRGAHSFEGTSPKHRECSVNTKQRQAVGCGGSGACEQMDQSGTKEATLGLCKKLRQDIPV